MRKARHAVLRRACKCLWLLKRLTRNRQKTAIGARHALSAQLCSGWVGSAFCVMRTSLGTPRAGAHLFCAKRPALLCPAKPQMADYFFLHITREHHHQHRRERTPLRSRNGGAADVPAAPLCFFTDSM